MLAEEAQQLKGAQNEGDKEDECASNDDDSDWKDSIEDSCTTDDNTSDWEDSNATDEKTLFKRLDLQHVCSRRSLLTTTIRDADSRHRKGPPPPLSESENLERISEESRTISQQLDTSTSPKSLTSLCSDDRSSLIMPVVKVPTSTHINPRVIRQKCLRDKLPVYLRECLLRE